MTTVVALNGSVNVSADPQGFDAFWIIFPRHIAKKDARKAWSRIDPELHVEVITAAARWRRVWAKKDPEYIPHPATWLNGERWEDELPADIKVSAASHIPFAGSPDEPPAKRTELPEQVRIMLRKLTGRAA